MNNEANGVARSVPTALADKTTALTAAYAVLGALYHRARTGEGQEIEVTMFETMVNYVMAEHQGGLAFAEPFAKPGYAPILDPAHKPFATRDGFVALPLLTDPRWETFWAKTGLKKESANLAEVFAGRTTQEWLDLSKGTALPIARVNSLEDLMVDPHLKAVDFWKTFKGTSEGDMRTPDVPMIFSDTPAEIRRPPPRLGEHSFEVLKELGLSQGEIDALVAEGATLQATV
jgi:crotonobetainyl-CoA:carnitine CoA-transferase CaiB-like acyl-CoA transferase